MKRNVCLIVMMILGLAFQALAAETSAPATKAKSGESAAEVSAPPIKVKPVESTAEISIPAVKAKSGESAEVLIKLDAADSLAGVKLVIKYDTELLTFQKADKTKETSSLMHIVNDKKPGILIIVMAGARGIAGKDFPLVSLTFGTKKDSKETKTTKIEITESQLMSEQLKDIAHKIKAEPLTILPAKSAEK